MVKRGDDQEGITNKREISTSTLLENRKKLWNMKVIIIPIVIGAFGMVTKGLLKGLEDLEVGGQIETIQTTALLKTARILRRVLETWGDLLSLNFRWKTISLCWCEKLIWVNNNNNNNKTQTIEFSTVETTLQMIHYCKQARFWPIDYDTWNGKKKCKNV